MNRNEKIEKAVINAITGDALGSSMEGFTSEHIKAVFKSTSNYTDPEPALKNRLENWRKPALYTSITQIMIILFATIGKGKFNIDGFTNNIKSSPDVENSQTGIFRHTDYILRRFIIGAKSIQNETADYTASVKMIPVCLPFALRNYYNDSDIYNQFKFCTSFTSDPFSISACLIFTGIIHTIINTENFSPKNSLLESQNSVYKIIEYSDKNSSLLFELKLNPDNILKTADVYLKLFESLEKSPDMKSGEKIILENLNLIMKNSVKKLSVVHPAAALPLALLKSKFIPETETLLKSCVMEGGSASSTASIAGAISGACGNSFPGESFLSKNLINKKNITSLINIISEKSWNNIDIENFYESELHLTKKESEELKSKLKHYKKPEKKIISRKSIENKMSQHIVESWTKTDKAKWKKEKKQFNKEYEESVD